MDTAQFLASKESAFPYALEHGKQFWDTMRRSKIEYIDRSFASFQSKKYQGAFGPQLKLLHAALLEEAAKQGLKVHYSWGLF